MSRTPVRIFRGLGRILARALGLDRRDGSTADPPTPPEALREEEDRRFREMRDTADVPDKPFHDLGEAPFHLYRLGLALAALRLGPRDEVLDFGAGTCWTSALLQRMGVPTVCLDVSPAALEIGRQVLQSTPRRPGTPEPELHTYDGRRLPFADGRFDAILCYASFHHVANPEAVLAEMHRVLKPAGRVVFCEPVSEHEDSATSRIERQRYDVLERSVDPRALETVARRIGFAALVRTPYPLLPDQTVGSSGLWANLSHGLERGIWTWLDRVVVFFLKKSHDEPLDSNHPGALRAAIEPGVDRLRGVPDRPLAIPVRIVNQGDTLWLADEHPRGGFVSLGCQLLDGDGRGLDRDWHRTRLPRPLPAGGAADLTAQPIAPAEPGRYAVKLDLVDENVCWFEERGSTPATVPLEVEAPGEGPGPSS